MTSNEKNTVALSSVFAGAALTLLKLVAGLLTGSIGILSEAAHSSLDLLAALLTYFAVRIGDKPADKEHPYGHGKVESVSALIETGLLFLTSFWIISEAVERLFFKNVQVRTTWYSLAVIIISIIVDVSRSRALGKVAKKTGSQALEADALHFSSDIWSSGVVLLGLILVAFGWNKADSIAAICVALFVMYVGYGLGKRTIDVLMDVAPEGLVDRLETEARKIEGVIDVEKIRVRPVGLFVFVDMTVNVNRKLSLEKTNFICQAIEDEVHKLVKEADITIRTKPLPDDNETLIERVQIAASFNELSVHDISVQEQGGKKYLSFDLELDSGFSVKRAHLIASRLEKTLIDEIGDDIYINIHIDPQESQSIRGESVPEKEEMEIKQAVLKLSEKISLIKDVHEVHARRSEGRLFITLHCRFDDDTPLVNAHGATSRLEYLLRESLPDVQRVVVHAEPASEDEEHGG